MAGLSPPHTQMHFISAPLLSRGQCLLQLHLQSVTTDCWVNCSVSVLADISWWIRRSEAEVISDLDYLSGVNERRTPPSVHPHGCSTLFMKDKYSTRDVFYKVQGHQSSHWWVIVLSWQIQVFCLLAVFFCCYCFFLAYLKLISQIIFIIIIFCTLSALTLCPLVFSLRLMSVLKASRLPLSHNLSRSWWS